MNQIELLFEGDGTFKNPYRAKIILGDHFSDEKHRFLSADCRSIGELEEQAEFLKMLLDKAVTKARRKFPKRN
jgi:hypothetical protein